RAVEADEAVRIGREMSRDPVEDDAEPRLVAGIDEGAALVGRPEAAGRREERDRLVAPGAVERILGDRQQLDMGEAELADIGDELLGELAVGKIAATLGEVAPPRAEMHLVAGDGRRTVVAPGPLGEPPRIAPPVSARRRDLRGGAGRPL